MACFTSADLTAEEQDSLSGIRRRKAELMEEIQQIQEELEQVNTEIDSLDMFTGDASSRLKSLQVGKRKFNTDPKKGLGYLFDHGLLAESAEAVAKFLYDGDGLKKSTVGDYLGENDPFNLQVLEAYVRSHNFRGLRLVDALRDFLWHFRLPGEAQKIDRIMEQFAKIYCDDNPSVFDHPDTCYTLCYATIMLNTSLHNRSVKEKMSMENFAQLTSSMSVPREIVNGIYNSIRVEAFKFPDEESNEFAMAVFRKADKQGWLMKQGSSQWGQWGKRWFVLNDKCLYYFNYPNEKEPKGIIPLQNIRVRALAEDKCPRLHTFEIYSTRAEVIKACKRADSEGRLVEGAHSTYRMAAHDREEMISWIAAIQRNLNRDHYIELLQARRKRISAGASDPTLNKL